MGSTKEIEETVLARQELMNSARKLAVARRETSPYSPRRQGELIEKLENYVKECEETNTPLTVSGFMLAADIPKRSWYDLKEGKFDAGVEEYKLAKNIPLDAEEYVTEDGEILSLRPWSEVIEHCYLMAQNQRELGCIQGKAGNVVGNIFLLKSQHGLNDQPDVIQNQQNIQIVADAETAMKALEMCR